MESKGLTLYLLKNKINEYYVVAEDPTSAKNKLEKLLDDADYGFFNERSVYEIKEIAKELKNDISGKPFFKSEEINIIF